MAIQVITYKNSAEIIRMDKSAYLSNRQDMTNYVKFEGGQNLLSPSFYINSTTEPTFNYVHIPEFNRYYFVDSKQWVGNNMWFITLTVDVLFSHKDDILNITCVASRLEDKGKHGMIVDDRLTAETMQYNDVKFLPLTAIGTPFNIQDNVDDINIVFSAFAGYEDTSSSEEGSVTGIVFSSVTLDPSFSPGITVYRGTANSNTTTVTVNTPITSPVPVIKHNDVTITQSNRTSGNTRITTATINFTFANAWDDVDIIAGDAIYQFFVYQA